MTRTQERNTCGDGYLLLERGTQYPPKQVHPFLVEGGACEKGYPPAEAQGTHAHFPNPWEVGSTELELEMDPPRSTAHA